MKRSGLWLGLGLLLLLGGCAAIGLAMTGSGLTLWLILTDDRPARPTVAPLTTRPALVKAQPTPTASLTPTPTIAAFQQAPPASPTPLPTETPTLTPLPPSPTATPLPPSDTPAPTLPPPPSPTATPEPTATSVPSYAFSVVENGQFPTGKADFDVFVAVTNGDNRPLAGYRVIGTHSNGWQMESGVSAGDWTENSGANHYKAGNIKYQAPNSPQGLWSLQLVDPAGQPVAAPLSLPFDPAKPSWYFVLFRQSY
jgi:hypothetical protein